MTLQALKSRKGGQFPFFQSFCCGDQKTTLAVCRAPARRGRRPSCEPPIAVASFHRHRQQPNQPYLQGLGSAIKGPYASMSSASNEYVWLDATYPDVHQQPHIASMVRVATTEEQ